MMSCPLCERDVRNVIDTRGLEGGTVIRRRRECAPCKHRFTTYERVETPEQRTFIGKQRAVIEGLRAACQLFLKSTEDGRGGQRESLGEG